MRLLGGLIFGRRGFLGGALLSFFERTLAGGRQTRSSLVLVLRLKAQLCRIEFFIVLFEFFKGFLKYLNAVALPFLIEKNLGSYGHLPIFSNFAMLILFSRTRHC